MRTIRYDADDVLWAALLAAQLAQECDLPHGNLWEPGIAQSLANMVTRSGYKREVAEYEMRLRLGLPDPEGALK